MASAPKTAEDYVEAAAPPAPRTHKRFRRSVVMAASFAAVCVGVVCVVALTMTTNNNNNNSSSSSSPESTSVSRLAQDRPEGTPFVHKPNCPVLAYCQDSYLSSDDTSKQSTLMQKIRQDTSSGPEASTSQQIGILDPAGLIDPNTNHFIRSIEHAFISFATTILNSINKGLDVRTTFGIGLDWQPLKHVYTTGDQLEAGRGKAIHAVGVTGAVTFDTSSADPNHPFTGMIKEGFEGIVRFSSAVEIKRGEMEKKHIFWGHKKVKSPFIIAPGLGLKALVDGKESSDLVAMWHLDGQPGEWNFFAHEFSTVVPGSSQTSLMLVAKHFEDASKCPSHISLVSFADKTKDGQSVAVPTTPYSLVFVPDPDLKASFDSMVHDGLSPDDEHACDTSQKCPDVLNTLTTLKPGQKLYTVYGVTGPDVQAWVGEPGREEKFVPTNAPSGVFRIGDLVLKDVLGKALDRSKFGDTGLFFRHQLFEDGVLSALCIHNQNWMPHMRMSTKLLSRNFPTCALGGNDNDGSDTKERKEIACRLLFRAEAIMPDCFDKVVELWNNGGFFPFPRNFDTLDDKSAWLDWCGRDDRPKNAASRGMVERSFS